MSLQFYQTGQLTLDRFAILFHGEPASGKTHQMASILQAHKPNCLAVNFVGEDGLLTARDHDLPAVDIESFAQWEEMLREILTGTKLKGLKAIGLDGLTHGYRMFMRSITSAEAPEPSDYQKSHPRFENQIVRLKRAVPIVVATCRSDRSMDQVREELWVTPDLPGRMAAGVSGLFDFVFYLEHQMVMGGKIEYRLYTAGKGKTTVRVRLPRALPAIISQPSWPRIEAEIRATMEGKPSPSAAVGPAAKPTTTAAGR